MGSHRIGTKWNPRNGLSVPNFLPQFEPVIRNRDDKSFFILGSENTSHGKKSSPIRKSAFKHILKPWSNGRKIVSQYTRYA